MNIADNGFQLTDWSKLTQELISGQCGESKSRKNNYGDIRIRIVKYSAGYEADHWCTKGHILHWLEGDLIVKLKDGTEYNLKKGTSFICGDSSENPHKVTSKNGATILIIDQQMIA